MATPAVYDGPIVDAHHHVWLRERTPWLTGPMQPRIFGPYEPIRRDYTIDEFMADALPAGVVASVYVQVNVAPGGELDETAWVQSVAVERRLPGAIVAFADLARPDLGALLDAHLERGRVAGIRQQLHWHENPQYRFAARPDLMNDPAWRRGLRELERRGLLFELQVFPSQMADSARLAADHPGVRFVLMHAGMPEDLSPAGRALWLAGLDALAAQPNVHVKLSGLGTFVHRVDAAHVADVCAEVLARFGASRCVFGSNFPIEKLWTGYGALVDAYRRALANIPSDAQRAVFHDNARRLYRLD